MKLFSKSEMQSLESAASARLTLSQMMENAGLALFHYARALPDPAAPTVLLCGSGNNGGDGFVCARHLAGAGLPCQVVLVLGPPSTALAQDAFAQLPPAVPVLTDPDSALAALAGAGLVIDCVYGFGFHGELPPAAARLLDFANRLPCRRLAADLPSGAECDTGRCSPHTFRAHATLAFTAKKIAHETYPAKEFCGQVEVCSVGISQDLVESAPTHAFLTGPATARDALSPLDLQANKGSQGRLLLICGSYGMAGACVMAARAALRCGVGLLNIAVEERIYPIVAAAVPEAVFTVYRPGSADRDLLSALSACTACAVGSGLGTLAPEVCPVVFRSCQAPLLLDADALNFCARTALPRPNAPLVLTPHPGEMARLCKTTVPEVQASRVPLAQSLSAKSGAVVLLKGAATVVAAPDGRLALNATGNPGLAKGGSGDVLTGVVGALLAQGAGAFEATAAGAWLHGAAGDRCARRLGRRSLLPTDLEGGLAEIFKKLERG